MAMFPSGLHDSFGDIHRHVVVWFCIISGGILLLTLLPLFGHYNSLKIAWFGIKCTRNGSTFLKLYFHFGFCFVRWTNEGCFIGTDYCRHFCERVCSRIINTHSRLPHTLASVRSFVKVKYVYHDPLTSPFLISFIAIFYHDHHLSSSTSSIFIGNFFYHLVSIIVILNVLLQSLNFIKRRYVRSFSITNIITKILRVKNPLNSTSVCTRSWLYKTFLSIIYLAKSFLNTTDRSLLIQRFSSTSGWLNHSHDPFFVGIIENVPPC